MADQYKVTYGKNFNRSKLSRNQEHSIALATCKQAKQHMIPDNGGVNLAYDRSSDEWLAQYVVETPVGRQQVGWSGIGKTAIEALRTLERQNYPHPLLIQQEWEKQDSGSNDHQPNKLN